MNTATQPTATQPTQPAPVAIIHVWFKCPSFGTNDFGCHLNQWPQIRKELGKKRIIRAELVGTLANHERTPWQQSSKAQIEGHRLPLSWLSFSR